MSWSRKALTLLATIVIGSSMLAAKKEDAAKKADKSEAKKDKKKNSPEAKPESSPAEGAEEKAPGKISVPVPPGHDAKGLVIPIRSPTGLMQMRFTMEIGARTDLNHMDMTTLLIETFDDEGNEEMSINLPRSILNLETHVLTTDAGVVIKRSDFEIAGQNMEFNTETRAGRLTGKVRMLIYNLENETNANPEKGSSAK
ncbi:MAG: LPS export ABC transporter periplasmic protein LptC [Chthoniobacteraceae bacterium]